ISIIYLLYIYYIHIFDIFYFNNIQMNNSYFKSFRFQTQITKNTSLNIQRSCCGVEKKMQGALGVVALVCLCLLDRNHAVTYYFSESTGNDAYDGLEPVFTMGSSG